MKNKNIQLYLGDSKEVLKQIPSNSVDLIVTDPPYGYSFMGKDWDKVVIPVSHWKECLRVLKSGAFAFVMSAPRQDVLSRMIYNLQEAGFETGFSSIYWSYATGFPKASNISKLIDKQECKKQLTKKLGRKPTKKEFEEAWKSYREIIGKKADFAIDGAKRNPKNHREMKDIGKEIGHNYGFNNVWNTPITKSESPQAKALDGSYSGFQPKPAVEIIIVVMKPLSEKTYVDQALKNGKGVTWLDNCRIPHNEEQKETKRQSRNENQTFSNKSCGFKSENLTNASASPKGRFPANLIVSDDVLNDGKISKSKADYNYKYNKTDCESVTAFRKRGTYIPRNDSGSYSRYFDLDRWWIERVKQLPPEVQKVFPYLIVPKASKKEKNKGCENLSNKEIYPQNNSISRKETNTLKEIKTKNNHPTVKPIKLMSYLITLGSKEGEVVLDPFMGSGTTGISAKLLNRKFIGIEMSEEYIKIAKARIEGWKK